VKNKVSSLLHDGQVQHDPKIIEVSDRTDSSGASKTVDAQKFVESLAKETASSIKSGVTEMRVQLEPEHLGKMTLRFSSEEGHVAVRIEVSNGDVKQMVDANMPRLRDEMLQRGVSMDHVDVFIAGDSLPRNRRDQSTAPQHPAATTLNHDDMTNPEVQKTGPRDLGYNTVEYLM